MAIITENILLGLSADLLKDIDRQARAEKIDRTNLIRKAIESYLLRVALEEETRQEMLQNRKNT
jgi:metal-responsive CopG/Arc/MetJ family transcriptional regulator